MAVYRHSKAEPCFTSLAFNWSQRHLSPHLFLVESSGDQGWADQGASLNVGAAFQVCAGVAPPWIRREAQGLLLCLSGPPYNMIPEQLMLYSAF